MAAGNLSREHLPESADWDVGTVLVVEDDERSVALMQAILGTVAGRIDVARTAAAALDRLAEAPVDLITLDVGLPDRSGLELLAEILELSDAPIIMVTAQGDTSTVVRALNAGAQDYIVKPVRPAELRARVRALARRAQLRPRSVDRYVDDDIVIDFGRSEVVTRTGTSTLSATERRLLRELVSESGHVLTHHEILRRVWGTGYEFDVPNLQVFISYLRKKLGEGASGAGYIQTHRGVGYEFVPHDVAHRYVEASRYEA